jgi:hypothetical protein
MKDSYFISYFLAMHTIWRDICHGGKQSKEYVTVLLCANVLGTEKLKPLNR